MEKNSLQSHEDGEIHFKTMHVLDSLMEPGCYAQVIAGLEKHFSHELQSGTEKIWWW